MLRSGLRDGSHRLWTLGGFLGGQTAPDMETPPGAVAKPRGRFRVGWRGDSQLFHLHYDIDEIVTSQAQISPESSQNCQIGTQAPSVPEVSEKSIGSQTPSTSYKVVHSAIHRYAHRSDMEAVDNRRRTLDPDRIDQPEGHPCC